MSVQKLDEKLDLLLSGQAELADALKSLEARMEERMKKVESRLDEQDQKIDQLSDYLSHLESQLDYCQGQDRRMNLLLTGVKEGEKPDTWDQTKAIAQDIFGKMGIDRAIKIQRCHRMGQFMASTPRPRRIVIKFAFYEDRDIVI